MDQNSIEDAHSFSNLELLEKFQTNTVILGAVAVASSRVETVEEVASRLGAALEHIHRDRLVVAPDCVF